MMSRAEQLKAVLRVVSGNLLEMYDFTVYGFYAHDLARTFFPSTNHYASLMATLVTFGMGFLMRPLGALVLGAYIDQVGRRKGLLLTLSLMAAGSLLIALVPGYATIGLLAPALVVVGRLLQGFSAGVELGGVSVYLSEIATPGHRGFYVSWQSASQQLAVILASGLGFGLHAWLRADQMESWGWRVPFLIGCLLVPVLFILRRGLTETAAFEQRERLPDTLAFARSLGGSLGMVGVGVMLVVMSNVSFYMITSYTTIIGKGLGLSDSETFVVAMCTGLSNFLWLPLSGALSDRVGRAPVLFTFSLLAVSTVYPVMVYLSAVPSFNHMLAAWMWLSFLYAGYNGAMVVALSEIMPPQVKTAAFSLAYSLSAAIFGGFTPTICNYLIHVTGNNASPGLWLATAAASGLLATVGLTWTGRLTGEK